jgi:hypothetical protein
VPIRPTTALVALMVVAVVGGTAWAWADFRDKVAAATSEPALATTTETATASPSPSASATPDPASVSSLWIGDGYTTCAAADDLGWTCRLDAEQGTGFLSDGRSFDQRFATLPDRLRTITPAPDVVVIDAGRNDLDVYAAHALAEAIATYAADVRAAYPDATLVEVVPWTRDQTAPVPELPEVVRTAMGLQQGYVVDPWADGWAGRVHTPAATDRALAGSLRALDLPVPTRS